MRPSRAPFPTWKITFIALYLGGLTLLLALSFSTWSYDDPYITYRYARNLAQGEGFVYNPGERVLSTTTPLFTLLLAIPAWLGIQLPVAAIWIGSFSIALGGLLLWALGYTWETPLAGWAALLLYPTFHLLLITLGSETPLYLALCLGGILGYARRQYSLSGLLCGLAVLARPDGILVPAVLALDFLWRRRKPVPWKAAAVFLLVLLPWVLFAWAYFGSPLPVTLAAKQGQGAMAISETFFSGFPSILGWYKVWNYRVEAILAGFGLLYLLARARPWSVLLAWTALYFTAYAVLGVSRYFWYYTPLVPGFIALVGLGAEAAVWLIQRLLGRQPEPGAALSIPLLAGVAVLAVVQAQSLQAPRVQPDNRAEIYPAVGAWLEANTPPEASFATLEVGMIGYVAQRPVVDFAGLIQPEVSAQMGPDTTYADTARWAVERYRPDYLVLQAGVFPELEARGCPEAARFKSEEYGYSHDIVIYNCSSR